MRCFVGFGGFFADVWLGNYRVEEDEGEEEAGCCVGLSGWGMLWRFLWLKGHVEWSIVWSMGHLDFEGIIYALAAHCGKQLS